MFKSKSMVFIDTPSHGYLRVDKGKGMPNVADYFTPSSYSYSNSKYYYLEEDCDAIDFLKTIYSDYMDIMKNLPVEYTEDFIEDIIYGVIINTSILLWQVQIILSLNDTHKVLDLSFNTWIKSL